MLQVTDPRLAYRHLQIVRGYIAFNQRDWPTLERLLCEDVKWHRMDGRGEIHGRDGAEGVIAYLKELREHPTEADLLGISSDMRGSIALDFVTGSPEGDHACADKILFDDFGCIREVWHCASATHEHGHAGHEAPHTHS